MACLVASISDCKQQENTSALLSHSLSMMIASFKEKAYLDDSSLRGPSFAWIDACSVSLSIWTAVETRERPSASFLSRSHSQAGSQPHL